MSTPHLEVGPLEVGPHPPYTFTLRYSAPYSLVRYSAPYSLAMAAERPPAAAPARSAQCSGDPQRSPGRGPWGVGAIEGGGPKAASLAWSVSSISAAVWLSVRYLRAAGV